MEIAEALYPHRPAAALSGKYRVVERATARDGASLVNRGAPIVPARRRFAACQVGPCARSPALPLRSKAHGLTFAPYARHDRGRPATRSSHFAPASAGMNRSRVAAPDRRADAVGTKYDYGCKPAS